MKKEQEKAIEKLNKILIAESGTKNLCTVVDIKDLKTALNLIQTQQEEIEKLKKHNKELLRKLRNRVKEVKKLTRYSLYKNEFIKLNKEIEKKDKIIDLILRDYIELTIPIINECKNKELKDYLLQQYNDGKFNNILDSTKQYFERKISNV